MNTLQLPPPSRTILINAAPRIDYLPKTMVFWEWPDLKGAGIGNVKHYQGWNDNAAPYLNCCDRFETLHDFL